MRSVVAGVLLFLSVLLVVPAVVTGWARAELIDTDRFVATFGPLAEEPAVQEMVTDQVMTAIEQNTDLSGLSSSLDSLNLPPVVGDLLDDVAGTAVEKVSGLIESSVARVLASESFAATWQTVLEQAHVRTVAILEDEPGSATTLQDGTLAIELGPIIEVVKDDLADRGVPFVQLIPQIEYAVPLLTEDSVTSARTGYDLTNVLGQWLPWVVPAIAIVGIALARGRLSALARTALGWLVMLGALLLALWIGRGVLVDEVAPQVMSAEAGEVIFDVTTTDLRTTVLWLIGLSAVLAIGGWIAARFAGRRRTARSYPQYQYS